MKDINNGSDEETSDDNEEKEEVKHGNLSVSVEGQGAAKDIPTVGSVVMDSLTFKASEETTLRSVTFETVGLTDTASIEEIRFEKDGVKIGYEKSFDSKGVAKVSLGAKGFTIKKNETLDLVVSMSGNAGSKIAFKVTDVDSTATAKISSDETVVCTLVTYGVAQTYFQGNNTVKTLKLGEEDVITLGTFSVQNKKATDNDDKRTITLKSISITNNGKAELEDLSDITVEKDGKAISSDVTIEKDKMIIVLNDEIESNVKPEYAIKATVDRVAHNGDTYELVLEEETDLIADETKSGFRSPVTYVTVKNSKNEEVSQNTIGTVTVNGGTIQIDGTAKSKDAAKGGKVLVAEGTLTTSTPVTFKNNGEGYSLIINITEGGSGVSKDDAYIEVNNTPYELKKIDNTKLGVKGNIEFPKEENTVKVYVTLSDENDDYVKVPGSCAGAKEVMTTQPTTESACTEKDGNWSDGSCAGAKEVMTTQPTTELTCTEKDGNWTKATEITSIKFDDIKAANFSNNGMFDSVKMSNELQKEIMGAIAMSNINIKDADLSLDKQEAFKNETHKYVVKSSNRTFTIFKGELTNSQIDTVVVNGFTITGTAKDSAKILKGDDYIELELQINGKPVSLDAQSRRITGTEKAIRFDNFSYEVATEDTLPVEVIARVYAYENDSATAEYTFTYAAEGYDKDIAARPEVSTTPKTVSTISILGKGEATANTNINDIKANNSFTRGDTVNFAKWNVSVKNDTLTLKTVTIKGQFDKDSAVTTAEIDNAKVSYVNNDTKAEGKLKKAGTVTNNAITFDGESIDLEPGNYTFTLSVSLNDDIAPKTAYTTENVQMTFENGEFNKDASVAWQADMVYTNTVYPIIPTVSLSKEIKGLKDAMEISIYNPGNEDLVISEIKTSRSESDSHVEYNNVEVSDSNRVTISKGQTAKFIVTAIDETVGYEVGTVIESLTSITMSYDDSDPYQITSDDNENFKDIKVEYRINN